MLGRSSIQRAPLSPGSAQTLLVSSLIEVIDCDRRLHALRFAFRAKVEPATWREIIEIEAQRAQTVAVALAVWDTAALFPRGSSVETRARHVLERDDAWTLDPATAARRPDLAEADREARRQARHPQSKGID